MHNKNTLTQYQNFMQVRVSIWDLWTYQKAFNSFWIQITLHTTHCHSVNRMAEAVTHKTHIWQKAGNAGLIKVRWLGWAVSYLCINYSSYMPDTRTTNMKSCRHIRDTSKQLARLGINYFYHSSSVTPCKHSIQQRSNKLHEVTRLKKKQMI